MVRWAPLNIPFERRLQTVGVLFWLLLSPFIGVPLILFLICLSLPFTWPIFIPYFIWAVFFDKAPIRGGRPLAAVKKAKIWHWFRDYFPISLVKTAELDPKRNYIFCYHPHGILSLGALGNFGTDATDFSKKFPGIDLRVLTLKINFLCPIYREFALAFGLCDVSRESCNYNLQRGPGASILIVIGGAQEALDAHPGINDLTLKNRKGFVRVALENGASLVPTFSFGENSIFEQVENPKGSKLRKWQDKMQKVMGMSLPIFQGRGIFNYDFGLMPYRHPIVTVVGTPLDLPKLDNPSEEEVNKWHAKYVASLVALYDQYKDVYDKDRKQDIRILG
jgi:2-acylglycerol O-acyltransferase 2